MGHHPTPNTPVATLLVVNTSTIIESCLLQNLGQPILIHAGVNTLSLSQENSSVPLLGGDAGGDVPLENPPP